MFGIPIGVHVTFLFVALLGMTAYAGVDIAYWTIAAFASILAHELGHALVARSFGGVGISVTLYGLGGLTTYRHGKPFTHGRSFLVSAAGSAVGIVLGGAVLGLGRTGLFEGAPDGLLVFLNSFIFTSLIWGVLNWVPIVPLDGGHMVKHLVSIVSPDRAPLIAQVITWIAVAILVPLAWVSGYRFAAIIVVFFALAGLREYRAETAPPPQPPTPRPAPPADPAPDHRQNPPEFPI